MRVVGAGFGRTGTTSLKAALEVLGFGPSYTLSEVFRKPKHVRFWEAASDPAGVEVDWEEFLAGYGVTVDWPACSFYAELMERYPDAKVLLSVRDPERWYESTRNTIYKITKIVIGSPFSRLGFALLSRLVFGTFKTCLLYTSPSPRDCS